MGKLPRLFYGRMGRGEPSGRRAGRTGGGYALARAHGALSRADGVVYRLHAAGAYPSGDRRRDRCDLSRRTRILGQSGLQRGVQARMEEVLRFRLASPARIGGKHLPFEQAEIPPLLQRAGQGLYVRQGVRTAEGDGGPLLRADPFAGQLFVVGDRKPRSESRLAVVRRRLYRAGVDRNLAHADLFSTA